MHDEIINQAREILTQRLYRTAHSHHRSIRLYTQTTGIRKHHHASVCPYACLP